MPVSPGIHISDNAHARPEWTHSRKRVNFRPQTAHHMQRRIQGGGHRGHGPPLEVREGTEGVKRPFQALRKSQRARSSMGWTLSGLERAISDLEWALMPELGPLIPEIGPFGSCMGPPKPEHTYFFHTFFPSQDLGPSRKMVGQISRLFRTNPNQT